MRFQLKLKKEADQIAQQINILAAKTSDPNSIPETHMVEITDSGKLFSDLQRHSMVLVLTLQEISKNVKTINWRKR